MQIKQVNVIDTFPN